MMITKNIIPTYYYAHLNEIEVDKIASLGVKYILADLDNTLTGFHHTYINKPGQDFLDKCKEFNIEVIVVSNNSYKRCKKFSEPIGLKFLPRADKPFNIRIKWFLKHNKINKDDCIFLGDQLYTDIMVANSMKMKSILVEPLTSKDLILTAINRLRDRKYRKAMKEKGMLKPIK